MRKTYSLVWKNKRECTNLLCFKVKQTFIPTLSLMRNLSIRMHNPKINNLLISRPNVPRSPNLWRHSRNVLIECLYLSGCNLDSKHVFRLKVTHVLIPLVHNSLLVDFSIWHAVFYLYVCLYSLGSSCLNSESFLLNSGWIYSLLRSLLILLRLLVLRLLRGLLVLRGLLRGLLVLRGLLRILSLLSLLWRNLSSLLRIWLPIWRSITWRRSLFTLCSLIYILLLLLTNWTRPWWRLLSKR